MNIIKQVLDVARSQLETKEYPPSSNNVKYNTAYYGREVDGSQYSWCAVFVWWVFRECGISGLYYGGQKTAYVPALISWARKNGLLVDTPEPGDLVCFDFNANGVADHIGICESWDGRYVTTIDGNTGTTSEANGGCVMRRRRERKYIVAVIRPKYEEDEEMDIEKLTQEQLLRLAERMDEARADQQPAEWSKEARKWAESTGLISGDEHGNKKYKVNVTCERLVQLLYNLVHKVI